MYDQPRGSPQNVGSHLSAVHPLVRTNPVTGWKSIYAIGSFPKYINELSEDESADLLKKLHDTILANHDLQVRFKWRNSNDIGELSRNKRYNELGVLTVPFQLSGIIVACSTVPLSITKA
jgi:hypothetical protein